MPVWQSDHTDSQKKEEGRGGSCNCATSHVRFSDWNHCAFPVSGVNINMGKTISGLYCKSLHTLGRPHRQTLTANISANKKARRLCLVLKWLLGSSLKEIIWPKANNLEAQEWKKPLGRPCRQSLAAYISANKKARRLWLVSKRPKAKSLEAEECKKTSQWSTTDNFFFRPLSCQLMSDVLDFAWNTCFTVTITGCLLYDRLNKTELSSNISWPS